MAEGTTTQTLPQVFLRNLQIPLQVLSLIPLDTVEKYQVAAYEVTDTTLKLAIVYPEQLKQGFYVALTDIGKKIGRTVQLFRTDHASMQALIDQYRTQKTGSVLPETPPPQSPPPATTQPAVVTDQPKAVPDFTKPPLFELGKTVAFNYLKRVPLAFSQQHHLVCVDYLAPNHYWFATDRANDPETQNLIAGIEKYNSIIVHVLPLKTGDIKDLIAYYDEVQKHPEQQQSADAVPAAPESPKIVVNPDIVVPETQATILMQEEALGGVAGFFQRVTQTMSNKSPVKEEATPVALPPAESPSPAAANIPSPVEQKPQPTAVSAAPPVAPSGQITSIAPTPTPPPAPAPVMPVSPPVTAPAPASGGDESTDDIGKLLSKSVDTLDELKEIVKKGLVPRTVAAIVNFAIHEKASDIHMEAFQDEVLIRYRVDGQLMEIVKLPPDTQAALVSRIKILSKLRLDETRVPQDGRFEVNFEQAQVDLRVSILPTVHGEKVVMRILDKNRGITSLESLGVAGLAYDNIIKSIQKPFGICLATGPTGSGKSTSLYAILKQIATPNVNVSTLEDPVEYEMTGINQSQIRPKIGFTFAEGLRALLRQDPNIIMVGEIRDGETANMATQAALTGHLVLSTLHTNEASGAVPRLENMGIEPFLIASSLNMVIGQRLVRKICQNCKSQVDLPEGLQQKFREDIEKIRQLNPLDVARTEHPLIFFQGKGCDVCQGKGYQGRLGIYEVMVMSPALEALTLARATGGQIQDQAQKEGMLTMYQDGLLKVLAGLTTLDEVLRETTTK